MLPAAARASSADLAIVRSITGVVLRSPKQPQPTSGLRWRSSMRPPVAVTNSTAVSPRTVVAGSPAPCLPAVRTSAIPSPSSAAHMAFATERWRRSGNSAVGPSATSTDLARSTRLSLAGHAPISIAASIGIWISRRATSNSGPDLDGRVEAALVEFAAQFDEAGQGQVGDPPARGRAAAHAAVAEHPRGGRGADHRQRPRPLRAVVPHPQHAADRQVRQAHAARRGASAWARAVARAGRCRLASVLLTGAVLVDGGVGEPDQAVGFVPGLVPVGGALDRSGQVPADQRRGGHMVGPVGGLVGGGDEPLQVTGVADADDVDEIAGLEPGELDLNLPPGAGADHHDLLAATVAPVHQQRIALAPDDLPGDASDIGPDPV